MATSSASSSNSELSNHPALKFDTKNMLLYYVHSNGSHGSYEPGKDIIAGNPSPKPFKDNYSLFAAMHDHLTGFPKPTDFILVTPDAPWAFVKALLDHESGKEGGVMVSLINPSKLDPKILVNVNQVFKQIGRNQHRMYDAQYLVWGRIPADAVTHTCPGQILWGVDSISCFQLCSRTTSQPATRTTIRMTLRPTIRVTMRPTIRTTITTSI